MESESKYMPQQIEPKKMPTERLPDEIHGVESLPGVESLLLKLTKELEGASGESKEQAAIERTQSMITRAELVEKLEGGAELLESDRETLGNMVKERSWFAMFKELKAGDSMAYFSSPGGEFSVKNLNTLFGEQTTDSIIDSRKKILNELMANAGHDLLSADYRSASFKIADSESDLNEIAEELNQRMRQVIDSAIEKTISENGADENKFKRMKELLSPENSGYRINFGTSVVGEQTSENDKTNIVQALSECAQTAQLSRHLAKDAYGGAYDRERVMDEINSENGINELGESLKGKSIVDESGIEYPIFSEKDGKRILNRDLLRLARKGEFKPEDSGKEVFGQVQQYVRRINLIDLVKPFTTEEASTGVISGRTEKMSNFVEKNVDGKYVLRADLSQTEREQLSAELKTDQKDGTYDAPEFFHKKATELKDCAYINLDVLDLGVDLLLEYEQLIQEIGDDETKLREASLLAGDKITENMRAIRAKALDVFKKYFPESDPIDRVGGDEIAFAVKDTGDSQKIEEFMLALQNETGTRVIKTVVGSSERHSSQEEKEPKHDDELLREHITALKRAEKGSEMAKKIEKKMRLAELVLEQFRGIKKGDEASLNDGLSQMEIKQFKNIAVTEDETGGLKVICRLENGEVGVLKYEEVLNWIGQAIGTVSGKFES